MNITAVLRNLQLSDLLKDEWFIQHRRIRKLVEIEEKLGYSLVPYKGRILCRVHSLKVQ
jgi:hypothetical protein